MRSRIHTFTLSTSGAALSLVSAQKLFVLLLILLLGACASQEDNHKGQGRSSARQAALDRFADRLSDSFSGGESEDIVQGIFSAGQLQAVQTLFPEGLTPLYVNDPQFEVNSIAVSRNDDKGHALLTIAYSKSNPSGFMSMLTIEHYDQPGMRWGRCLRQREPVTLEHPTLGEITLCKQSLQSGGIGAHFVLPESLGSVRVNYTGPEDYLQLAAEGLFQGESLPPVATASDTRPSQDFEELLADYTPSPGVLQLNHPDYQPGSVSISWLPMTESHSTSKSYVRAVPLYETHVTLHFVVSAIYGETYKPKTECKGSQYQQRVYHHEDFGPFLLCIRECETGAKAGSGEPMLQHVAHVSPMPGNQFSQVQLRVDGFPEDIDTILASLTL